MVPLNQATTPREGAWKANSHQPNRKPLSLLTTVALKHLRRNCLKMCLSPLDPNITFALQWVATNCNTPWLVWINLQTTTHRVANRSSPFSWRKERSIYKLHWVQETLVRHRWQLVVLIMWGRVLRALAHWLIKSTMGVSSLTKAAAKRPRALSSRSNLSIMKSDRRVLTIWSLARAMQAVLSVRAIRLMRRL